MMLIGLFIIFILLLIILLIFLKESLTVINQKFNHLRVFINKNYGIFTLFFILVFFFEQLFLIYFVSVYLEVSVKAIFISIFALIVLTTATLEKFILEKKFQYQKQEVDVVSYENQELLKDAKNIVNKYEILYRKYHSLKKKG